METGRAKLFDRVADCSSDALAQAWRSRGNCKSFLLVFKASNPAVLGQSAGLSHQKSLEIRGSSICA